MSMKVSELIREIEAFMQGSDWSASPQLRRMYTAYCEFCRMAADELDECRVLIEKGNLTEARQRNLASTPPLTARIAMLEFAKKKEFIELAISYGFSAPVEADAALIAKLNAPVSGEERDLQGLMRRWRQVARAGKTAEKIELLRKIIALIPPEGALEWKKNLASLERLRDAEIAELLPKKEWSITDLEELQAFLLELSTPNRLTAASDATLAKVRELLHPLQKAHIADQIENKLNVLQALFAERNIAALNQAYAEFLALATHPLAALTSTQQQTQHDVGEFLKMENRRCQAQERFDQLVADLGKAFEEGKTYEEIERIYNELRLLDLPLSDALVERYEVLRNEHDAIEKRRVVRRGIYATLLVGVLLIAVGVTIHYAMYFRSVKNVCASYDKLLQNNDFSTVIAKYEELKKSDRRIARDAKVVDRVHRAESMRDTLHKNQTDANAEYLRASARIGELLNGDFLDSPEIDATIESVEKILLFLSEENRNDFSKLKTTIAGRRIELQNMRKGAFLRNFENWKTELLKIKANLASSLDLGKERQQIDAIRRAYQSGLDHLHPSVREEVGKACDAEWKQINGDVDFAFKREVEKRELCRKLDHPQNLYEHLQALQEIAKRRPDIARNYQQLTESDVERFVLLEAGISFLESHDLSAVLTGIAPMPDDGRNSLIGEDVAFITANSNASPVDAVLDKWMKDFDYYEVAVKTSQGGEIVLYGKDKPAIQRVNRETVRGVRVNALRAINDKILPVNIRIKGERYSLECNEKQAPELQNLAPIIALDGIDLQSGECAKNATYLLAQKVRQAAGMSREEKLRAFICQECALKEKNCFFQLIALQQAYHLLAEESPLYAALTKPALTKLDALLAQCKGTNPLQPHKLAYTDAIRQTIADLAPEKMFEEKEKIQRFYVALLQRGLTCAGVIDADGKLVLLPDKTSGELLVFADGGLALLHSDLAKNEIVGQEKKYLYPGQVVWGFADGVPNREFFRKETLHGAKLPKLPAQWPTNIPLSQY